MLKIESNQKDESLFVTVVLTAASMPVALGVVTSYTHQVKLEEVSCWILEGITLLM